MSSLMITIAFTSILLVLGSLQCAGAASMSAPAPADPELLSSVFAYHGFVNTDARNAFFHDLEVGDAPGASEVLESNIAPAYSTGQHAVSCISSSPHTLGSLGNKKSKLLQACASFAAIRFMKS